MLAEETPSGSQAEGGPKLWGLADFGTRFGEGSMAALPRASASPGAGLEILIPILDFSLFRETHVQ